MIHVVVAGALDLRTVEHPIVARTTRVLDDADVPVGHPGIVHSYDELFDDGVDGALESIAADLAKRGTVEDIVYLVPTLPGDATVDRLNAGIISSIAPGLVDRGSFAHGRCLIVDALEIAIAEFQSPFERGLLALDPTIPTIVTNWYGAEVTELAGRRLRGLYGTETDPGNTSGLELRIPAIERLHPAASIAELEHIVARLRRPDGCPWDREQTRESLYPQFEEELEELGDAIRLNDVPNQREELGDVLFHVIAQCQLAAEAGDFTLDDVLREVTAKLLRRHPHVFGDVTAETYDDVLATWNRVKAEEKSRVNATANEKGNMAYE